MEYVASPNLINKSSIDTEQDIQKAKKKAIIVLALFPLFFIIFIIYGIYWAYFDMSHLPKEKVLAESTSPDGVYTVKAYLINGGATTAYAVLGELSLTRKRGSQSTFILSIGKSMLP